MDRIYFSTCYGSAQWAKGWAMNWVKHKRLCLQIQAGEYREEHNSRREFQMHYLFIYLSWVLWMEIALADSWRHPFGIWLLMAALRNSVSQCPWGDSFSAPRAKVHKGELLSLFCMRSLPLISTGSAFHTIGKLVFSVSSVEKWANHNVVKRQQARKA